MTKCLMITDIAIWVSGAGHISRIKGLIRFLTKYCYLTIVYIGRKPSAPIGHLLSKKIDIIFLESDNESDKERNLILVNKLLNWDNYKICFVEYIYLSYFLRAIPDHVISILDTHDIISERNESFNNHNYENLNYSISKDREYKIFKLFDYVMFISQKDYNTSLSKLSVAQMILAPHPAKINVHDFREDAKVVGFVASDYLPNVDAICWFLESIWNKVPIALNLKLNIYGNVSRKIPPDLLRSNVVVKGHQNDLAKIYAEMDIAINPVRFGSGLKIKNMEALSNGIPLITTTHGASGLEFGIGKTFRVADSDEHFLNTLIELAESSIARKKLSTNAHIWIKNSFKEEHCFRQVKKFLV